MACSPASSRPRSDTAWLPLIGAAGQAILFLISLVLARALPEGEFRVYVLAASLFALLSGMATLGMDQLVLKVLPSLKPSEDVGKRIAFQRFVLRRALVGTTLATFAGIAWAVAIDPSPAARQAIMIGLVGLPLAVAAAIASKVMVTMGLPVRGLAATQIILPGIMLVVLATLAAAGALPGGAGVIALWGVGWAVALAVLAPGLRGFLAVRVAKSNLGEERSWSRAALPLFGRRAAVALSAQAGILATSQLASRPGDVSVLAIASVAAALVLVPATMTQPVYARDLAPLVRGRDAPAVRTLLRRRALRIAPATGLAVAALLFAPDHIVTLFGYPPEPNTLNVLRLLALSAAMTAALGILPVLHVYAGRARVVMRCLLAGLLAQLAGLLLLVPELGAVNAVAS
jgi:O-antigen/teichoic acid export membrane protein